MGFQQEHGLDVYFMNRAKQADKPVAGLEKADAALVAMDAIPYSEQAHDLDELLDNPLKAMSELKEHHTAWKKGDAATLNELAIVKMARETPESYRLLIVNRTNNWLPAITQRLDNSKTGTTLVVVGVGHVIGLDGLLARLQAKGYKVERICSACAVTR
jgi:uncharacterized protein YbaP (TraB family)